MSCCKVLELLPISVGSTTLPQPQNAHLHAALDVQHPLEVRAAQWALRVAVPKGAHVEGVAAQEVDHREVQRL